MDDPGSVRACARQALRHQRGKLHTALHYLLMPGDIANLLGLPSEWGESKDELG
jgi:hypothetical protein